MYRREEILQVLFPLDCLRLNISTPNNEKYLLSFYFKISSVIKHFLDQILRIYFVIHALNGT